MEGMASEIVNNGFEEADPDGPDTSESEIGLPSVELALEDGGYSASAVALYAMPGLDVLSMMVSPEPAKMVKMFDLFQGALHGQKARDDLAGLTFQELNAVIAQWLSKSAAKEIEDADGLDEKVERELRGFEGLLDSEGGESDMGGEVDTGE